VKGATEGREWTIQPRPFLHLTRQASRYGKANLPYAGYILIIRHTGKRSGFLTIRAFEFFRPIAWLKSSPCSENDPKREIVWVYRYRMSSLIPENFKEPFE
jgi:hypothetical protein